MAICEWKDHKGRPRIYLSRKWPDKTRFRRIMPNRTVAKNTDARISEAIAMGTWRELKKEFSRRQDNNNPTMAEFADIYLEQYCRVHNRRPDFKEQALTNIVRIVGDVRLKDFSRRHAHHFVGVRSCEVAPATVNRGMAVIKNMLTFALELEYIDAHPLHRFKHLPESQRALRIMTVEEYRTLVDAAALEDQVIGAYLATLGETGLRRSEGLRLKWSDVDLRLGRLTVTESKNGRPRYIPLTRYAREWLAGLVRVISCPSVFVCLRTGKAWVKPEDPFKKACKAAGLQWVRGFHDLRHFRATQWLRSGMDIRQVQELLGHSNISTTMRYVHYNQKQAFEAVRAAERVEVARYAGGRKVDGAQTG